ncbi:sugar/nucleoside kinase (ribokinase family) [Stella humosa]|uniref:Sugar/nucleoside kinase (Ribokinase family) n=2 Tax=Stella humosa TaxID=94 RepID=A0A3N1ME82_9PROT|nr:sugar/nucleoside kinase (ribokinase family) [Stella humosa]
MVGSAHVDRVWRLTGPLVPGGRQRHTGVESRYGGGAFHTGSVLLALGHKVGLATALSGDETGRRHRQALADRGFDLAAVETVEQPTEPLEILLDPAGDRTILLPAVPRVIQADLDADGADLVYLNVRNRPGRPETLDRLAPRIVSQLPLDREERRPSRILVASRSDLPGLSDAALLTRALGVAGPAFEWLVVTAGAQPVTVLGNGPSATVPVPPLPAGTDTTGAGDFFAAGLLDGLAQGMAAADAAGHAVEIGRQVLLDRARFVDARIGS